MNWGGGNTALHLAVKKNSLDIVKQLIKNKANSNIKNNQNTLPRDLITTQDTEERTKFQCLLHYWDNVNALPSIQQQLAIQVEKMEQQSVTINNIMQNIAPEKQNLSLENITKLQQQAQAIKDGQKQAQSSIKTIKTLINELSAQIQEALQLLKD